MVMMNPYSLGSGFNITLVSRRIRKGGCLPRGVGGGGLPGEGGVCPGSVSQHAMGQTPPVNGITLPRPKLRLRVVTSRITSKKYIHARSKVPLTKTVTSLCFGLILPARLSTHEQE